MRFRIKLSIWVILMVFVIGLGVASIPPANAQFILASWDYPDDFGQGIFMFQTYENSTSSWEKIGPDYEYDDTFVIPWSAGVGLRLSCWAKMNFTLTNSSTTEIGKNFIQHNISVTNRLGAVVFTQQNFTYGAGILEGSFYNYRYDVIFEFALEPAELYTATIICEIYW